MAMESVITRREVEFANHGGVALRGNPGGGPGLEPVFRLPSGLVARGAAQAASQMNGRRAETSPPYRTRLTGQLAPLPLSSVASRLG